METHILSCTCLNYKLKILKKRCQERWENAYLTLKNTRGSRALRRALDPGLCMLASLALRHSAPSANLGKHLLGAPWPNPGSAPGDGDERDMWMKRWQFWRDNNTMRWRSPGMYQAKSEWWGGVGRKNQVAQDVLKHILDFRIFWDGKINFFCNCLPMHRHHIDWISHSTLCRQWLFSDRQTNAQTRAQKQIAQK